jgi:hypothetical protein
VAALQPAGTEPHASARDVGESLTIGVVARTDDAREALRRLDQTAPATRALRALDAADRVALGPALVGASRTGLPAWA